MRNKNRDDIVKVLRSIEETLSKGLFGNTSPTVFDLLDPTINALNDAISLIEGYYSKTVATGKIIEGAMTGDLVKVQAYASLLIEDCVRNGNEYGAKILRNSLSGKEEHNLVVLDSETKSSEKRIPLLSVGEFGLVKSNQEDVTNRYVQADLSKKNYDMLSNAIDDNKAFKIYKDIKPSLPIIHTNTLGKIILIEYNDERYLSVTKLLDSFNITQSKYKRVLKLEYPLNTTLGYCLGILDAELTLEIANKLNKSKVSAIIDGVTYIGLKDVAEKLDITVACLSSRVTAGWTMEDIINTPQNHSLGKKTEVEYNGKNYGSLREFAEAFGLNYKKVSSAWGNKKSIEDIISKCKLVKK